MIHQISRSIFLRADRSRVWDFFSTPTNLDAMTPPEMSFEIIGSPGPMYTGQVIAYRIRILPGIRVSWLTEITHVSQGSYFVDEQRVGPYRVWHHEHRFVQRDGGVEVSDLVTYALGFGPLGDAVHALWVRRQLKGIFDYRERKLAEIFKVESGVPART
jgi:ligand-binding SRPBCC domain-containing protein